MADEELVADASALIYIAKADAVEQVAAIGIRSLELLRDIADED